MNGQSFLRSPGPTKGSPTNDDYDIDDYDDDRGMKPVTAGCVTRNFVIYYHWIVTKWSRGSRLLPVTGYLIRK
jgi:hypothetical protein